MTAPSRSEFPFGRPKMLRCFRLPVDSSNCSCCRYVDCVVHYPVTRGRRGDPARVQCPRLLLLLRVPYPRSNERRPCWRWLLGAFQTGFVPSPPPPSSPTTTNTTTSPLPIGVLSGCVYLSVCYVPGFKCTVSIRTFNSKAISPLFFCL